MSALLGNFRQIRQQLNDLTAEVEDDDILTRDEKDNLFDYIDQADDALKEASKTLS